MLRTNINTNITRRSRGINLPDDVLQAVIFTQRPTLRNGNWEFVDVSGNDNPIQVLNYSGSGPVDWTTVQVRQYADTELEASDALITGGFWYSGGSPVAKSLADFVPNIQNIIFANTRTFGRVSNVITIRASAVPLNDNDICLIKLRTRTCAIYLTIETDTLICACDTIDIPNINDYSYSGRSLNITLVDSGITGLAFNNDGSKMFMIGNNMDSVYQFTLSTPGDIMTATYDNISFNVSAQDVNPRDIALSADGTVMFMVGAVSESVHQYSLTTGFDLSTISFDNVSFQFSTLNYAVSGVVFNPDGTKFFISEALTDSFYEYNLLTPHDLSSIDPTPISLDTSVVSGAPRSIDFSSDGKKIFTVDVITDAVYQFNLPTPYSLVDGEYSGRFLDVSDQETTPFALEFSSDGSKMYLGGAVNDTIFEYEI